MIYFENASLGEEGFNTHLLSYTLCVSLSNFLDRDFYFDYEIPCSTPPDYAFREEFRDKYKILLESERSLVTDLVEIPARRRYEIEREAENKLALQLIYSYFCTTEKLKARFGGTLIWDSFSIGRFDLTREYLQSFDLIEWTHSKLANPSVFYFLPKPEKDALLESVRIKYLDEIEGLTEKLVSQVGKFNAFHLRLGDFLTNYKHDDYSINTDRFKKYVKATFTDESLPILAATDGLHEKEMICEFLADYRIIFIDELIFDDFSADYKQLKYTDFNVLTILNQLIYANAAIFIGTYRSTFTSIIHRLRQERFGKKDFNFFPDNRVARLLTPDFKIKPDRAGFFDWNRYSIFAEDHPSLAWMREWDFDSTTLNF